MSNRRNAVAHRNRKSRRTAAADRRSGHQITGVPLISTVIKQALRLSLRPAVAHHRGWSETNESTTYEPMP
jgi:hypothetical protein